MAGPGAAPAGLLPMVNPLRQLVQCTRTPNRTPRIVVATRHRLGLVDVSGQDCDRLRQRLEGVVYSGGGSGVLTSPGLRPMDFEAQLTDAKSDVEVALRSWLTTPTFSELLLVWNLLALNRRRVEHVIMALRRRQPSGYGKTAVYTQLPLAHSALSETHSWMERLSFPIEGTTIVCYWFLGAQYEP